ncbi:MAG: hypothetical protein P4M12_11065 [Gammaproteobacteria bacterium]|nr:hypothetical protein [Gammaproteobacteria bacterium]
MANFLASKIHIDNEHLIIESKNYQHKTYTWVEFLKFIVETNDSGPFGEDIFFILVTETDEIKIPQSIVDDNEFDEITQRFPNFDYAVFIEAMSSCKNFQFICWESKS